MKDVLDELHSGVFNMCMKGLCYNRHVTNVNQIKSAVEEMKRGKHDSNRGLCCDHVKHGGERLYTYTCISVLFTAMVSHGCIPCEVLLSTIIPIQKKFKKTIV